VSGSERRCSRAFKLVVYEHRLRAARTLPTGTKRTPHASAIRLRASCTAFCRRAAYGGAHRRLRAAAQCVACSHSSVRWSRPAP
jgi:hypothetical protein